MHSKFDVGNRFSLFKILFFIKSLYLQNLFWAPRVPINIVIGVDYLQPRSVQ